MKNRNLRLGSLLLNSIMFGFYLTVVITNPQNDFLSPDGVAWGVVGKNVVANNTVANIDNLFKTAKVVGMPVFSSIRCHK